MIYQPPQIHGADLKRAGSFYLLKACQSKTNRLKVLKLHELPSNELLYDCEVDILGSSMPKSMVGPDAKIFVVTDTRDNPPSISEDLKSEELYQSHTIEEADKANTTDLYLRMCALKASNKARENAQAA